MSVLARPGALASILAASAVVLHPALGASRWLPARPAVLAALFLLAALALVARAAAAREGRPPAALAAAGAALLVGALAVDGLRGHHGTLTLVAGQSRGNFDEAAPDGRSLGLRPLGFPIGAERVSATGGQSGPSVALAVPGHGVPVELTPERSVPSGGYRFARPAATTSGVVRLRIGASDGTSTQVADVSPGAPGRVFDLTIALEDYFPDFALDESRRPFSRSAEPRNPAALLAVERRGEAHRVFVLQSMPGVHRVEQLGLAFSLLGVELDRAVEIEVHREPAALAALFGAVLVVAGVAWSRRIEPAPVTAGRETPAFVAGSVLVGLLLLADRGGVLAWSFAVPGAEGRAPLPGVGVLLGAALVPGLGGSLLLAAERLAGGVAGVWPIARGALWLAVGLATAGLGLAAVRAADPPAAGAALASLAGLAVAVAWLAASLLAARPGAPGVVSRVAPLALPLAVLVALAVAIAAGVSGVLRDGTYATPSAASSAAAALLGVAALEPTGAPGPRRFAFALALLALAVN